MPNKQLDFLDIFDHPVRSFEAKKSEASSAKHNNIKPLSKEEIEFEREQNADRRKAQEAKQVEHLKYLLASNYWDLSLDDFKEFTEELSAYQQRLLGFKKEARKIEQEINEGKGNTNAKQKEIGESNLDLHWKSVFPEVNDDPEYRDLALLWIKYKKVLQQSKAQANTGVEVHKKTRKTKSGGTAKKIKTKADDYNNNNDDDDNSPDPYGDIYPYSRKFRRKRNF